MLSRILIAFLLLVNSFALSGKSITALNSGWKFKEAFQPSQYLPASVPGTIHTDLLANKLIPDPFIGTNENKVQWVESRTWEYINEFTCDKSILKESHIELNFEGLDTYAKVFLNDSLILTSKNMFVAHTVDVKRFIKAKNTLKIIFLPAAQLIAENRAAAGNIEYPGGDRVYIRKAQYQFGWDWGPRLVTSGIWKPITLQAWSGLKIVETRFVTQMISNNTASAFIKLQYFSASKKPVSYTIEINGKSVESATFRTFDPNDTNEIILPFTISDVKLWWPNGYGEPYQYDVRLILEAGKYRDESSMKCGIRQVTWENSLTKGFVLRINGVRMFCKGANWIPQDNFVPRVTQSKTESQLKDMQLLNMNMVRVWGGGVYGSDYFYSICDSLGLMVWQDLMFACSMYPYAVHFKRSDLESELQQTIKRTTRHCSVVMLCGDNENYEGWTNWGWQKQFNYDKKTQDDIYSDYINFNSHMNYMMSGELVHDEYGYWSSSPKNGWGREEAYKEGDVHYWGVWWGDEPFTSYETHVGRFVSEYGFQGCPSVHTFSQMGADVSNWLNDSTIRQHQKHPTGYQTISRYMKRDYGIDTLMGENYIYFSQVLQRDAMRTAIEAHRRAMPYCMGTLFWQYNDCWPVTSWSVEDYYGRKKMAWHELKRLYAPIMTSVWTTNDSVFVSIINEYESPISGEIVFDWNDFNGKSFYSKVIRVDLPVVSSEIYLRFAKSELSKLLPLNEGYVHAHLIPDNQKKYNTAERVATLCKYSELKLPAPQYSFTANADNTSGVKRFTFTSKVFMKDVMFSFADPESEFSLNGFDALPGVNYSVELRTKQSVTSLAHSVLVANAYNIVPAKK